MSVGFFGLEIVRTALSAQRKGMEITNHNVANMSNPGYSRQTVSMQANTPFPNPSLTAWQITGQVGTGVDVTAVQRMRETFIDAQIRKATRDYGYYETVERLYTRLEKIINEPSESGINQALNDYWKAWQELSKHPEDISVRAALLQKANALADAFNETGAQLDELAFDVSKDIETKMMDINSYARQLANVNEQIKYLKVTGNPANDLRDHRDYLVDSLAKIVGINVYENNDGTISVTINGNMLVNGLDYHELDINQYQTNGELRWADSGNPALLTGGEIGALITIKNTIPEIVDQLDNLLTTLANRTNALHAKGVDLNSNIPGDENPFFQVTKDGNATSKIRVMIDAPEAIAAASQAEIDPVTGKVKPSGNGIALEITKVNYMENGSESPYKIDNAFQAIVGSLGVQVQAAKDLLANKQLLNEQLANLRDSVSGVSFDEEGNNLVRYQQAFAAACKMTTIIDEMLDQLILGTGSTR